MTIEFLSVIPADPNYVPPPEKRKAALAALERMLPRAEAVDAVLHGEIRFIDSGALFETILCPLCGSELDHIWWGDAMSNAEMNGFKNLSVRLPCCDAAGRLDNLNYKMPAGFARFLLQAREPGPGRYLTVDRLQALESILGTPLKQIWSQYRKRDKEEVRVYRAALGRR